MWSDILNKFNQGKAFLLYIGELMNVPEDYDDEVERGNTFPALLTEEYRVTSSSKVLQKIT